jgi:hypothetical protein
VPSFTIASPAGSVKRSANREPLWKYSPRAACTDFVPAPVSVCSNVARTLRAP